MTTRIPLVLRIKKESYRKIAIAQDSMITEVYTAFNKAVLHGGTAIWRCYAGKRFSEDLDFYLPKEIPKIEALFESIKKKGFRVLKRKVSENSVYSELEWDRITVRFEATFQKIKGHLVDYENIDGTFTTVYSLTPEEFIREKVNTYLKRLKGRDLYDIFFLISKVQSFKDVREDIKKLIQSYKNPTDRQDLKTIILEGIVPKPEEMIEYLKTKCQNT